MISEFAIKYVLPIIIAILFALYFRGTFEKLSWKFLAWFLILAKIPDVLTTCLGKFNYGYGDERNPMLRWMLININLPDVILVLIHAVIVVSFFLLIFRIMWRESRSSKILAKIFLLAFSIGSIICAILNLSLYLSG